MDNNEFNSEENFFADLEKRGITIDPQKKERIKSKMKNVLSYRPKVGILGKTGVGKSSLCNALFGKDVAAISHTKAQTREIQEELLNLSEDDKGIILIDVPGIGESIEKHVEYVELYKKLLPEIDIILWLLKADERAYSLDEEFYSSYLKPYLNDGKPMLFVLSQVDKISPSRNWDLANNKPGEEQVKFIIDKKDHLSHFFNIDKSKIIPVSASDNYNLIELVDEIIFSLPNEKKITVLKNVETKNISEEAKEDATKGFLEAVFGDLAGSLAEKYFGQKAKDMGEQIGSEIGRAVDEIFSWIKNWF